MNPAMLKHIPIFLIVIGAGGILLFGVLSAYLFIYPAAPFTPEDIVVTKGVLDRAEETNIRNGSGTLQLWLAKTQLPFRSQSSYPGSIKKDVLDKLRPGIPVTIGTLKEEQKSPRTEFTQGQQFRSICSLSVGGRVALSLEDYNAWCSKNNGMGKIVAPILVACSIATLGFGLFLTCKPHLVAGGTGATHVNPTALRPGPF